MESKIVKLVKTKLYGGYQGLEGVGIREMLFKGTNVPSVDKKS